MTDTTTPQQPTQPQQPATPSAPEAPLAGTRRDMPARVIPHRASTIDDWIASEDRIPVFTVTREDGTHRTFSMPSKPNPGVMLGFLRDTRTQGDAAIVSLMDRILDAGAVDALVAELEAMEPDEASTTMSTISERMQRNLAGGLQR